MHGDIQQRRALYTQGVKGVACIWRANEEYLDKFNLALDLPADLVTLLSQLDEPEPFWC